MFSGLVVVVFIDSECFLGGLVVLFSVGFKDIWCLFADEGLQEDLEKAGLVRKNRRKAVENPFGFSF